MCLQSLPALLGRADPAQPELPAPHVSPCLVSPPRWGQASPGVLGRTRRAPGHWYAASAAGGAASPSPAN